MEKWSKYHITPSTSCVERLIAKQIKKVADWGAIIVFVVNDFCALVGWYYVHEDLKTIINKYFKHKGDD